MRNWLILVLLCLGLVPGAWAAKAHWRGVKTDKVVLQLADEAWVTTASARVVVNVDATLNSQALAAFRQRVQKDLQTIAKSDNWHITRFNQRKGQSGLEQVNVQAETRIASTQLGQLRSSAKKLSKPGVTYRVNNIDFTPDLADQQKIRAQLREKIYQQVKAELKRLNAVYPKQQYRVHNIDFVMSRRPAARGYQGQRDVMMMKAATPMPTLKVGEKLQLRAMVVLGTIKAKDHDKDDDKD